MKKPIRWTVSESDYKNQSFVQKKGLKSGEYDYLAVNVSITDNVKAGRLPLLFNGKRPAYSS